MQLPKGMTFATLRADGGYRLGIKTERGILDAHKAEARFSTGAPTSIDDVFAGKGSLDALKTLVERSAGDAGLFVSAEKASFGPCVTKPEKVICVGLNYRRHAEETKNPIPEEPVLFNKFNNSLNHHRGQIKVTGFPAERYDYEVELVIVMGRETSVVSEADALKYVFGYCTGNDFSVRDLQGRTSQWMLGKAGDGWAPIGPYLVSADQVDPNNLDVECRVNGQVRQKSNTSDMIFTCAYIVSYISRYMTLQPGDVIFTGTPEGVILGYPKEQRVWLKPGDQISTTVGSLGTLDFALV